MLQHNARLGKTLVIAGAVKVHIEDAVVWIDEFFTSIARVGDNLPTIDIDPETKFEVKTGGSGAFDTVIVL